MNRSIFNCTVRIGKNWLEIGTLVTVFVPLRRLTFWLDVISFVAVKETIQETKLKYYFNIPTIISDYNINVKRIWKCLRLCRSRNSLWSTAYVVYRVIKYGNETTNKSNTFSIEILLFLTIKKWPSKLNSILEFRSEWLLKTVWLLSTCRGLNVWKSVCLCLNVPIVLKVKLKCQSVLNDWCGDSNNTSDKLKYFVLNWKRIESK